LLSTTKKLSIFFKLQQYDDIEFLQDNKREKERESACVRACVRARTYFEYLL